MRNTARLLTVFSLAVFVSSCENRGADRVLGSDPREIVVGTVAEIRALEVGARAQLDAVAITAWNAFGDSSIHVRDATGAIRATRVAAVSAVAGDSVQVLGTVAVSEGQPTIDVGVVTTFVAVGAPTPLGVTTGSAATGTGGANDAALVSVIGAAVTATGTSGLDVSVTIDDGSGPVDVIADAALGLDVSGLAPGVSVDVQGVLIPTNAGAWQIKPRMQSDITVATPLVTIQQAKSLPVGSEVVIAGVALNNLNSFDDESLHITDGAASIRATVIGTAVVFEGDSVLLRGTLSTEFGQRIITLVTVTRINNVGPPSRQLVTTAVAASAVGGLLDAALVQITRATISNRTQNAGVTTLTVNDVTGPLTVEIDFSTGIPIGSLEPGAEVTFAGVLVPIGTGAWKLKPRSPTDITVLLPVVSINAARSLPVGDTVVIVGVALNNVTGFGDGSVHVADTSAAIRVFSPGTNSVFTGDSVRFRGVIGSRSGQRTLENAAPTIVGAVGPPTSVPVTTLIASTAFAGRFDANLVSVANAIITSTAIIGGDFIMTVNDGTGLLQIVLDQDIPFNTVLFAVGVNINATGVLVPTGAGTWQMKPRGDTDLAVNP